MFYINRSKYDYKTQNLWVYQFSLCQISNDLLSFKAFYIELMVSYQHHSCISGNLNTPHKVSIDSTFSEMTVQQEIPLKKQ